MKLVSLPATFLSGILESSNYPLLPFSCFHEYWEAIHLKMWEIRTIKEEKTERSTRAHLHPFPSFPVAVIFSVTEPPWWVKFSGKKEMWKTFIPTTTVLRTETVKICMKDRGGATYVQKLVLWSLLLMSGAFKSNFVYYHCHPSSFLLWLVALFLFALIFTSETTVISFLLKQDSEISHFHCVKTSYHKLHLQK